MAFREVGVVEVREVLRGWLDGAGLRTVGARAGVDRKTARRYVLAAQEAGLCRDAGPSALTDELIGVVVAAVRPVRPNGHGSAWETLSAHEDQIRTWVGKPNTLSIVKVHELLARQGVTVPYRTLHRFAVSECGFGVRDTTVRVAEGEPVVECQIDFAQMGFIVDTETGRRRRVHALIFTAAYSRHLFVWLTYSQTLTAVIAGCEAAWVFFGGVFKVLIPDNVKAVVTDADAVNPRLSTGWLDYAQHTGFATDPARVRKPRDKPKVERAVQYVRGNFFAGETFIDLDDAQARVVAWCSDTAGMRVHGSTATRPLEVFTQTESPCLLPVPAAYDQPVFTRVKVHRDFHVEIARALYSVPEAWLGQHLDARADSVLVTLFHSGQLVTTHPRQPAGGRSTVAADLPEHKASYAMRDLARLTATCAAHGPNVGIYAERLLDDPRPWTRMRAVYRLIGLIRRYGAAPVEAACSTSLDLDVVSVGKIAAMLEKATENTPPALPATAGYGRGASPATQPSSPPAQYNSPSSPAALPPPPSKRRPGHEHHHHDNTHHGEQR